MLLVCAVCMLSFPTTRLGACLSAKRLTECQQSFPEPEMGAPASHIEGAPKPLPKTSVLRWSPLVLILAVLFRLRRSTIGNTPSTAACWCLGLTHKST